MPPDPRFPGRAANRQKTSRKQNRSLETISFALTMTQANGAEKQTEQCDREKKAAHMQTSFNGRIKLPSLFTGYSDYAAAAMTKR